jgi:hypothetical protein
MADDVHGLPDHDLALVGDERVPAVDHPRRLPVLSRLDRDEGGVQIDVRHEQDLRRERVAGNRFCEALVVDLDVEVGEGPGGRSGIREHVVVRQQQPLTHQEPAAEPGPPSTLHDRDPRDRPCRPRTAAEERDALQLARDPQNPLQLHRLDRVGVRQRPRERAGTDRSAGHQVLSARPDLLRAVDDRGSGLRLPAFDLGTLVSGAAVPLDHAPLLLLQVHPPAPSTPAGEGCPPPARPCGAASLAGGNVHVPRRGCRPGLVQRRQPKGA